MRDKSVSRNSNSVSSSSWMDDFLSGLAKKFSTKTANAAETEYHQAPELTVTAEVNINDLDKVTWNDETFYVMFDNQGASVFNEFGNVVTTLKGVHSIDEVDQALNSKQVVLSSNEDFTTNDDFQTELAKIIPYLDQEASAVTASEFDTNDTSDNETVDTENNSQPVQTESASDFDTTESGAEADQDLNNTDASDVMASSNEEDEVIAAVIDGFSEVEERLAAMEQKLNEMGQEYARLKELVDVDNHSSEIEQKHFEENAHNTQVEIEKEHNIDLTTPQGRVELSQEELGRSETQIDVKDEPNEVKDDSQDQAQAESTEETQEDSETNPEETENVEVSDSDKNKEQSEESKKEDSKEVQVEALNEVESKVFKHAICVSCGEQDLTKSAKAVGDIQGVYCSSCPAEYAINLETEEIFIRL